MPIIKASEILKIPSMLLYGDNRCGKTHLLSTAAQLEFLCPTLIVDADSGAVTAQRVDGNQDIFQFDTTKSYLVQLNAVLKAAKEGKYKFIAVDTLSYLMHRCLMEMSSWAKPTFNHYSALFAIMHKFILDLKAITPYFCATCFIKHEKNDDGDITSTFPMIVGQDFPRQVASEFNILGFMHTKTEKKGGGESKTDFILRTKQAGKEKSGDRLGVVGDLVNPTMTDVFKLIGYKL